MVNFHKLRFNWAEEKGLNPLGPLDVFLNCCQIVILDDGVLNFPPFFLFRHLLQMV